MLSAIRKILAYSVDFDPKQESGDCRTREAIRYNLQVIGAAAARLPEPTRALAPDIPWEEIVGFRNILVHEYFRVDLALVSQVISSDPPVLQAALLDLAIKLSV